MSYQYPLEDLNENFIFHGWQSKRSTIYIDPNGNLFYIEPHAFIKNSRKETILWDGRGHDQFGRAFHFSNSKRDFNVKMTPQEQPNWMGNRRPNLTTSPKLRRGRYQGSDVAVYSTIFGDTIDWVETRRGNFGNR